MSSFYLKACYRYYCVSSSSVPSLSQFWRLSFCVLHQVHPQFSMFSYLSELVQEGNLHSPQLHQRSIYMKMKITYIEIESQKNKRSRLVENSLKKYIYIYVCVGSTVRISVSVPGAYLYCVVNYSMCQFWN